MRPIVRGAAALLAVPALTVSALVATSAPASAAPDPAPADAAAAWLSAEVPGSGLFSGDFGPDFGLSIDVALALDAVDDDGDVVARIRDAVEADVDSYIAYSYEDGGTTHTGETGGATAKALVLDRRTGGDGTDFGGVDLVERLESLVDENGRVISTFDGAPDPSYDNTYIQTLALTGLDGTGSPVRAAVLDYTLAQQCEAEGYFRGDIPEGPSDPCADEPDTDSTAQAVLALQGDATAEDAVAGAVSWLVSAQRPNGAFGGGVGTEGVNANSTGLAAAALAAAGRDGAATRAAAWLRAHQATNVANCVHYAETDLGAVLYDDAARAAAQDGPMDQALTSQTVRATSQALPGLLAAQDGDPRAIFTGEYVKAGGSKLIGVGNAAPGEAVCAMLGEQSVLAYADVDGDADLRVRVPAGTARHEVSMANADGVFATVEVNALGKQELRVSLAKQRVARGGMQTVTIWKLAPAETTTVTVGGTKVRGQANGKGVLKARFTVTGKPGKRTVKVTGAFKNRTGTAQFTVTR